MEKACSKILILSDGIPGDPSYIVLSASDEFKHKTSRVNQLWRTDFTYFKIISWGGYYLSTVLDDFSGYIIACLLTNTMAADDVKKPWSLP